MGGRREVSEILNRDNCVEDFCHKGGQRNVAIIDMGFVVKGGQSSGYQV